MSKGVLNDGGWLYKVQYILSIILGAAPRHFARGLPIVAGGLKKQILDPCTDGCSLRVPPRVLCVG